MEYVNELTAKGATREDLSALVRLVGPFAPHLGDEAWERLGEKPFLIQAAWPIHEEALTIDAVVTLAVQVNGKLRGTLQLAKDAPKDTAEKAALALPEIVRALDGKTPKRVIVVPNRIVNVVV
jgi:leucyl-tRNA synthetase